MSIYNQHTGEIHLCIHFIYNSYKVFRIINKRNGSVTNTTDLISNRYKCKLVNYFNLNNNILCFAYKNRKTTKCIKIE